MSTKRPYGTGSLIERNGSWYGQWRAGGRQIKRKLGPIRGVERPEGLTRSQAERELRVKIGEVRPATTSPAITIDAAGARYIEHLEIVKGRKPATLQDYRIILRKHLVPAFPGELAAITTGAVENFIRRQIDAGGARQSVLNRVNFLSGLFKYAMRQGWADANPAAAAERPSAGAADEEEMRFLTPLEVEALIREVPDDHLGSTERALYLAAAMTGLRQGELLALRWKDVDWTAGVIRVVLSYSRGRLGRPKSRRSARAIPLADRVARELDLHFKGSHYQGDEDRVFCHPDTGHFLDASKLRKRFRAAAGRAGLGHVRFHDLRHTFGTAMAAAGAPMRDLMAWMGHADFATTLRYAHYSAEQSQGARFAERAFAVPSGSESGASLLVVAAD